MIEETKEDIVKEDGCGCGDDCGCDHDHEHDHKNDGCGDDCGCGHDHGHSHPDVITLTLENDEDVECVVIGIFNFEDKEYIALLPRDSEDVFIYIYLDDQAGNVNLENIESQDDFDKVSAAFLKLMEEEDEVATEE